MNIEYCGFLLLALRSVYYRSLDIDACYEIGANSYIQKPVEFTGFVSALSMLTDYWFEISVLPKTESPGRS